MKRSQMVLAGLLALQLLLILLFRSPLAVGSGAAEMRPLLPGLAALTAAHIELSDGEESLDLVRGEEGWTVAEAGGYPADEEKVRGLLDDLRALEVGRPVVSSSRYHGALGVAQDGPEARVRVWAETSEDPAVELLVGTSPGYRRAHARLSGEDEVYEVEGLASYDLRPEPGAWVEKQLLDVPVEQVAGLALRNAKGAFALERAAEGWRVVGGPEESREIDEEALGSFLRAATSLTLAEPVGPVDEAAHGLADPAAVLTLSLSPAEGAGAASGGETVVIRVGGEVPDETSYRYATREGGGFTVKVWESSLTKLLEQSLDDLLA